MRQSKLFGKTLRETPHDEKSINAEFLMRAGFIDKLTAGVYSYLPLGLKVLRKIQQIVREEMNAIGGQEVLMPAMHPKEKWEKTGRWGDPGKKVMFQFEGHRNKFYGLGWTHEEIITPLVKKFVRSYKDLPLYLYQIQDKFRNEGRAKSGILRGMEFNMKDLYSFHKSTEDLENFYQLALQAYLRIFERCGLNALVTESSGGSFSKYSHEFQVPTVNGEDIIYTCVKCGRNQNKEIVDVKECPSCGAVRQQTKAIEVGNIFKLGTRFSSAFDFTVADENGKQSPVIMGCFGLGPSRVMGSIVEVHNDKTGIIWPMSVAPFTVHLISLQKGGEERNEAEKLYEFLTKNGIDALYDDREDVSVGEKFKDSDLIGIPFRVVVSEKTVMANKFEIKERKSQKTDMVDKRELLDVLS